MSNILDTVTAALREHSEREGDKCPCAVCDAVLAEDQQLIADWLRALVDRLASLERELVEARERSAFMERMELERTSERDEALAALAKLRAEAEQAKLDTAAALGLALESGKARDAARAEVERERLERIGTAQANLSYAEANKQLGLNLAAARAEVVFQTDTRIAAEQRIAVLERELAEARKERDEAVHQLGAATAEVDRCVNEIRRLQRIVQAYEAIKDCGPESAGYAALTAARAEVEAAFRAGYCCSQVVVYPQQVDAAWSRYQQERKMPASEYSPEGPRIRQIACEVVGGDDAV